MKSITSVQLKELITQGKVPVLIDVREAWEYNICHIDGSQNIPLQEVDSSLAKLDKDAETVIICHHGMRSLQVANYLCSLGYKNIMNLDEGIDMWSRTVAPEMPH
ncbi:MAG: rhodanese-like domain-containing protein [Gammaproteobacteria bacterium]|nr:rhodanese-like domain-containing protein [Gammaproteobacteria bacterium]